MVPRGLTAIILATIPFQQGLVGGDIIKILTYGVVLFSIILTSVMIFLVDKTGLSKMINSFLFFGQNKTGIFIKFITFLKL
jgi:cell volume regulation protein A